MSRVVSSTLVPVGTAPTDTADVWAPLNLFLVNWAENVELQHEWPTSKEKGQEGAETRWGTTDHPIRVIKGQLVGMDTTETWQIFHMLRRHALARALFPLYTDHTKLISQIYFQWQASSPGIAAETPPTSGEVIFNFNEVPSPAWDATQDGLVIVCETSGTVTVSSTPPVYDPVGLPAGYNEREDFTLTVTGTFAGFTVEALTDDVVSATPTTAQMWASNTNSGNRWITVDFGDIRLIQKFRWYPRATGGTDAQLQSYSWFIIASNDPAFGTFETVATGPTTYTAGWNEITFLPTQAYRYYRVQKTAHSGTTQGHLTFVEIEFYDYQGLQSAGEVLYQIPNDAVVLKQTTGTLSHTAPYRRIIENNAETIFYMSEPSYAGETVDAGNDTDDVEAAGFDAVEWSGLDQSKIEGKGWPDGDGTTRLKFFLIPWGSSTVTVSLQTPATLLCDTRYRRFFPGAWVAVGTVDETCHGYGPRFDRFHLGQIESMGEDFLALAGGIDEIYPANSRVYPMVEVELLLTSNPTRIHSKMIAVEFIAREVVGPTALLPVAEDNSTLEEDGYTLDENDVPIIDWRIASNPEMSITLDRDGDATRVGNKTFVAPVDPTPRVSIEREWTATSREDAWRMLRLWERSGGDLRTFWGSLPIDLWEHTSLVGDTYVVPTDGRLAIDWAAFTHLMFRPRNTEHTAEVIEIESIEVGATTTTITLVDSVELSLAEYLWIRPAYLMRFGTNTLTEKWVHDQMMQTTFVTTELLSEQPDTTDIGEDDPGPEPDPEPIEPQDCSEVRAAYGINPTISSLNNSSEYREYGTEALDDTSWMYAVGIDSVVILCDGWDEDMQAIRWKYIQTVQGFGVNLSILGTFYGDPLGQPFDIYLTYNHGTVDPPEYWDTLVLSNA